MFARLGAVALLALISTACAHPNTTVPRKITVYQCVEEADAEQGRFRVEPASIHWERDLGEGVRIGLDLNVPESEQAQFAARGLDAHPTHPLILTFDRRFANRGMQGGVRYFDGAVEVRVGDRALKRPMPAHLVARIPWSEMRELAAGDGEIAFTLYGSDGAALERRTLPSGALANAERTIRSMHARATERLADKDHLCTARRDWPIREPVFVCTVQITTPEGGFSAFADSVVWYMNFGNGVALNVQERGIRSNFADGGLGPATGYMQTWAAFYNPDRPVRSVSRYYHGSRFRSEMRVGGRSLKRQGAELEIDWRELKDFLDNERGEMVFTLYARDGAVVRQGSLPHDTIANVDIVLRALQAHAMEKEADETHRCGPVREGEIVVTQLDSARLTGVSLLRPAAWARRDLEWAAL